MFCQLVLESNFWSRNFISNEKAHFTKEEFLHKKLHGRECFNINLLHPQKYTVSWAGRKVTPFLFEEKRPKHMHFYL